MFGLAIIEMIEGLPASHMNRTWTLILSNLGSPRFSRSSIEDLSPSGATSSEAQQDPASRATNNTIPSGMSCSSDWPGTTRKNRTTGEKANKSKNGWRRSQKGTIRFRADVVHSGKRLSNSFPASKSCGNGIMGLYCCLLAAGGMPTDR